MQFTGQPFPFGFLRSQQLTRKLPVPLLALAQRLFAGPQPLFSLLELGDKSKCPLRIPLAGCQQRSKTTFLGKQVVINPLGIPVKAILPHISKVPDQIFTQE